MQARGEQPLMPDNPAPYLVDWLFEIGPSSSAGMGEGPIGWMEIAAWQALAAIDLDPWEARILRRLSAAFVDERYHARDRNRPPPYSAHEEKIETVRDKVTGQFRAMWNTLRARQNSK